MRPVQPLNWDNVPDKVSSTVAAFTVVPRCSPLDLVRLWCGGGGGWRGRVQGRSPAFMGGRSRERSRPSVIWNLAGQAEPNAGGQVIVDIDGAQSTSCD
jgi:hypothetical protein